jgi:hypothetical protein
MALISRASLFEPNPPIMERTMPTIGVLVSGTLDRADRSPEELEQDAERILDVLEEGGAIGPAVGCDLVESTIAVRFSVDGEDSAAVHRHIGNLAEMIDEAVGGRVRTAMTPATQVELTCA